MKATALTLDEILELNILNTKLFKGNLFKEFTTEEENSNDFKRQDELMRKKMAYLKEVHS
jgi:hypothetical protein